MIDEHETARLKKAKPTTLPKDAPIVPYADDGPRAKAVLREMAELLDAHQHRLPVNQFAELKGAERVEFVDRLRRARIADLGRSADGDLSEGRKAARAREAEINGGLWPSDIDFVSMRQKRSE